jgi:hypothetical protein
VEEVVQVGEEHLRLHHVLEAAAGGVEHALQVVEDVARLLLDVGPVVGERRILPRLGRHAGLVIGGDLAGGIERVAREHALAIVRHRRRRGFPGDHFPSDSWLDSPQIDLDLAAGHEQATHLHGGARRRRGEKLLPDLVEMMEVVEVEEKDLGLHDVLQLASARLEHLAQVAEDVARLLLDVRAVIGERRVLPRLGRHARPVVRGDLAGRVERLAGEHAFAVVGHGRRRARALDHFAFHERRDLS